MLIKFINIYILSHHYHNQLNLFIYLIIHLYFFINIRFQPCQIISLTFKALIVFFIENLILFNLKINLE